MQVSKWDGKCLNETESVWLRRKLSKRNVRCPNAKGRACLNEMENFWMRREVSEFENRKVLNETEERAFFWYWHVYGEKRPSTLQFTLRCRFKAQKLKFPVTYTFLNIAIPNVSSHSISFHLPLQQQVNYSQHQSTTPTKPATNNTTTTKTTSKTVSNKSKNNHQFATINNQ